MKHMCVSVIVIHVIPVKCILVDVSSFVYTISNGWIKIHVRPILIEHTDIVS